MYILQAFKWISSHLSLHANIDSIWMQIKLVILSIQTFAGQHEHAVSRFHIILSTHSDN